MDVSAWRRQFREALPAGARVVDVGCGSGRDLAALLEMGFDAYGCEPAEGYGLRQGRHWAEWLAVISAGIYLLLEFQHFAHHPIFFNAAVICLNVLVVLYLAKLLNQQRAGWRGAAGHRAALVDDS